MSKARVSQNQNQNPTKPQSNKLPSNVNANKVSLPNPTYCKPQSSLISSRIEPWNHKQFLKRVSTFNSLKWHIKRIDITPLLCARYGWECIGKNTLECSGCKTKINYKTNRLWSADINNKVANTFKQNIISTHTPKCEWKLNPCNVLFENLPMNISIMKQEIINNLRSWAQTDNNLFYLIPIIHQITKNKVIKSQFIANNKIFNNNNNHKKYELCINLMLLSVCGWHFNNNKYIQCKYCNKCISLHSYDYKKVLTLFPYNNDKNNSNTNSCLDGINEESESENEEDISTILNRELPISDTKSVINRLSRLGLKINNSNIKRIHSFQIYETPKLQKQASFINNNNNNTNSILNSGWGGYKSNNNNLSLMSPICWPKQSILTQPNSMKKNVTKNRKKRSRFEMSIDISENDDIYDENKMDEMSDCPRKKMRFSRSNSTSRSNSIETPLNNNNNINKIQKPQPQRKNRKRKTMDSDFNETISINTNTNTNSSEFRNVLPTKKRRINSLSTSISTSNSFNTPITTPINNNKNRISRKRKFNDMFISDEEKEKQDINNMNINNVKRVRLDTPIVNKQKYFDVINLHNNYCPFKNKHKYNIEKNKVFGWEYCLGLLPNDIIYIQQIAEQSKKGNNGKRRF